MLPLGIYRCQTQYRGCSRYAYKRFNQEYEYLPPPPYSARELMEDRGQGVPECKANLSTRGSSRSINVSTMTAPNGGSVAGDISPSPNLLIVIPSTAVTPTSALEFAASSSENAVDISHAAMHTSGQSASLEHAQQDTTGGIFPSRAPGGLSSTYPVDSSPAPIAIPAGFVLHNTIPLFGSKLSAEYYEYHGPLPPGTGAEDGTPRYELAIVKGDLCLPDIIPELSGTTFDGIVFNDVMATHQTAAFDKTKLIGWTIEANLSIGKETGGLYDTLTKVFGVNNLTVHLLASLGDSGSQSWHKPISLHNFVLEGILPNARASPCSGLTLTQIGVRLLSTRPSPTFTAPSSLAFGFEVLGEMHLSVPRWELPLQLNFTVTELDNVLRLNSSLKGDMWRNALGITGLDLSSVTFTCTLTPRQPMTTFEFDVEGLFCAGTTSVDLRGSYYAGSHFALSANLEDVRWSNLHDIHFALKGVTLASLDLDISMSAATLFVSSDTGLAVTIHDMSIGDFVSVDASADISAGGLVVHGALSKPAHFGGFVLQDATFQVSLPSTSSGGTSNVSLTGAMTFLNLAMSIVVQLYPSSSSKGASMVPGSLEWTAFAFIPKDGDFTLADLDPALRGSFLQNVVLHKPIFIITSSSEPHVPPELNIPQGLVSKGIQVCAPLGQLSTLNSLTRSTTVTDDLYLRAGWSRESGFSLDVTILSLADISLGHSTKLEPGHLNIVTTPRPCLRLSAGISVPVSKQTDPLLFDVVLSIDAAAASVTGEMHGYWINPFGISENLKIGPNLALKADVVLAQFLATGTLSGFGFSGALQFGKISAQLEFDFNETASGELLHGKLDSLDMDDVVTFVRSLSKLDLPSPPSFAHFEHIDMYICPLGASIGSTTYPAGASFSADVTIFGVRGDILASMGSSGFKMDGRVDDFSLGPFSVRGTGGDRPLVDIEFDGSKQHVVIDGLLKLFDVTTALHLAFDIAPRPDFFVNFALKFVDELSFTVNGVLSGPPDFRGLGNIDFNLEAVFQQDLLEHLTREITQEFVKARQYAHQDVQAAEANVAKYKQSLEGGLNETQAELDQAQAAWQVKVESTRSNSQDILDNYERRKSRLEARVSAARNALENTVGDASMEVRKVNDTRADALKTVQDDVSDARGQWNRKMKEAEDAASKAEEDVRHTYKNIQKEIDSAQGSVIELTQELSDINRTITEAENAPWWNAPAKASLPALYTNRLTCGGELAAAKGILEAARAMIHGPRYLHAQDAAVAARHTLGAVQDASRSANDAAEDSARDSNKSAQPIVKSARRSLSEAQHGPLLSALHEAEEALAAYNDAEAPSVASAQTAVNELEKSAEWRKYQAAIATHESVKGSVDNATLAEAALQRANGQWNVFTNIATWAAEHSLGLLVVNSVSLSGSFHDLANNKGFLGFDATITGTIVGQNFHLTRILDLRDPAGFVTVIFGKLWKDVETGSVKTLSL